MSGVVSEGGGAIVPGPRREMVLDVIFNTCFLAGTSVDGSFWEA